MYSARRFSKITSAKGSLDAIIPCSSKASAISSADLAYIVLLYLLSPGIKLTGVQDDAAFIELEAVRGNAITSFRTGYAVVASFSQFDIPSSILSCISPAIDLNTLSLTNPSASKNES